MFGKIARRADGIVEEADEVVTPGAVGRDQAEPGRQTMSEVTLDTNDAAATIREDGFVICEDVVNGMPCLATAGLSATFGHPELVVVGMEPMEAAGILSAFAGMIEDGKRFESAGLAGRPEEPFAMIRLAAEAIPSFNETFDELLGARPATVQIFESDDNGFFPWEEGCDPAFAMQMALPLAEEPPSVERMSPLTTDEIAARRRAIVETMKRHVEEHGWTLQSVFGSEVSPPFTYTIGLSASYAHPEVYVCGLPHEVAQQLLATVCQRVAAGERFDTPKIDTELANMPAAFRPVRDQEVADNSGIGQDVLDRAFSAVQLFWPDPAGNMPWEAECDPRMAEAQLSLLVPEGDPPAAPAPASGVTLH